MNVFRLQIDMNLSQKNKPNNLRKKRYTIMRNKEMKKHYNLTSVIIFATLQTASSYSLSYTCIS